MKLIPGQWVWVSDAEDKATLRAMFRQAHIAGASGTINTTGHAPICGPVGYVPGPMTWTLGSVTVNGVPHVVRGTVATLRRPGGFTRRQRGAIYRALTGPRPMPHAMEAD